MVSFLKIFDMSVYKEIICFRESTERDLVSPVQLSLVHRFFRNKCSSLIEGHV